MSIEKQDNIQEQENGQQQHPYQQIPPEGESNKGSVSLDKDTILSSTTSPERHVANCASESFTFARKGAAFNCSSASISVVPAISPQQKSCSAASALMLATNAPTAHAPKDIETEFITNTQADAVPTATTADAQLSSTSAGESRSPYSFLCSDGTISNVSKMSPNSSHKAGAARRTSKAEALEEEDFEQMPQHQSIDEEREAVSFPPVICDGECLHYVPPPSLSRSATDTRSDVGCVEVAADNTVEIAPSTVIQTAAGSREIVLVPADSSAARVVSGSFAGTCKVGIAGDSQKSGAACVLTATDALNADSCHAVNTSDNAISTAVRLPATPRAVEQKEAVETKRSNYMLPIAEESADTLLPTLAASTAASNFENGSKNKEASALHLKSAEPEQIPAESAFGRLAEKSSSLTSPVENVENTWEQMRSGNTSIAVNHERSATMTTAPIFKSAAEGRGTDNLETSKEMMESTRLHAKEEKDSSPTTPEGKEPAARSAAQEASFIFASSRSGSTRTGAATRSTGSCPQLQAIKPPSRIVSAAAVEAEQAHVVRSLNRSSCGADTSVTKTPIHDSPGVVDESYRVQGDEGSNRRRDSAATEEETCCSSMIAVEGSSEGDIEGRCCTRSLSPTTFNARLEQFPRVVGVRFDRTQCRWLAGISVGGRTINKYFPVYKYGFEGARRMAVNHRLACLRNQGKSVFGRATGLDCNRTADQDVGFAADGRFITGKGDNVTVQRESGVINKQQKQMRVGKPQLESTEFREEITREQQEHVAPNSAVVFGSSTANDSWRKSDARAAAVLSRSNSSSGQGAAGAATIQELRAAEKHKGGNFLQNTSSKRRRSVDSDFVLSPASSIGASDAFSEAAANPVCGKTSVAGNSRGVRHQQRQQEAVTQLTTFEEADAASENRSGGASTATAGNGAAVYRRSSCTAVTAATHPGHEVKAQQNWRCKVRGVCKRRVSAQDAAAGAVRDRKGATANFEDSSKSSIYAKSDVDLKSSKLSLGQQLAPTPAAGAADGGGTGRKHNTRLSGKCSIELANSYRGRNNLVTSYISSRMNQQQRRVQHHLEEEGDFYVAAGGEEEASVNASRESGTLLQEAGALRQEVGDEADEQERPAAVHGLAAYKEAADGEDMSSVASSSTRPSAAAVYPLFRHPSRRQRPQSALWKNEQAWARNTTSSCSAEAEKTPYGLSVQVNSSLFRQVKSRHQLRGRVSQPSTGSSHEEDSDLLQQQEKRLKKKETSTEKGEEMQTKLFSSTGVSGQEVKESRELSVYAQQQRQPHQETDRARVRGRVRARIFTQQQVQHQRGGSSRSSSSSGERKTAGESRDVDREDERLSQQHYRLRGTSSGGLEAAALGANEDEEEKAPAEEADEEEVAERVNLQQKQLKRSWHKQFRTRRQRIRSEQREEGVEEESATAAPETTEENEDSVKEAHTDGKDHTEDDRNAAVAEKFRPWPKDLWWSPEKNGWVASYIRSGSTRYKVYTLVKHGGMTRSYRAACRFLSQQKTDHQRQTQQQQQQEQQQKQFEAEAEAAGTGEQLYMLQTGTASDPGITAEKVGVAADMTPAATAAAAGSASSRPSRSMRCKNSPGFRQTSTYKSPAPSVASVGAASKTAAVYAEVSEDCRPVFRPGGGRRAATTAGSAASEQQRGDSEESFTKETAVGNSSISGSSEGLAVDSTALTLFEAREAKRTQELQVEGVYAKNLLESPMEHQDQQRQLQQLQYAGHVEGESAGGAITRGWTSTASAKVTSETRAKDQQHTLRHRRSAADAEQDEDYYEEQAAPQGKSPFFSRGNRSSNSKKATYQQQGSKAAITVVERKERETEDASAIREVDSPGDRLPVTISSEPKNSEEKRKRKGETDAIPSGLTGDNIVDDGGRERKRGKAEIKLSLCSSSSSRGGEDGKHDRGAETVEESESDNRGKRLHHRQQRRQLQHQCKAVGGDCKIQSASVGASTSQSPRLRCIRDVGVVESKEERTGDSRMDSPCLSPRVDAFFKKERGDGHEEKSSAEQQCGSQEANASNADSQKGTSDTEEGVLPEVAGHRGSADNSTSTLSVPSPTRHEKNGIAEPKFPKSETADSESSVNLLSDGAPSLYSAGTGAAAGAVNIAAGMRERKRICAGADAAKPAATTMGTSSSQKQQQQHMYEKIATRGTATYNSAAAGESSQQQQQQVEQSGRFTAQVSLTSTPAVAGGAPSAATASAAAGGLRRRWGSSAAATAHAAASGDCWAREASKYPLFPGMQYDAISKCFRVKLRAQRRAFSVVRRGVREAHDLAMDALRSEGLLPESVDVAIAGDPEVIGSYLRGSARGRRRRMLVAGSTGFPPAVSAQQLYNLKDQQNYHHHYLRCGSSSSPNPAMPSRQHQEQQYRLRAGAGPSAAAPGGSSAEAAATADSSFVYRDRGGSTREACGKTGTAAADKGLEAMSGTASASSSSSDNRWGESISERAAEDTGSSTATAGTRWHRQGSSADKGAVAGAANGAGITVADDGLASPGVGSSSYSANSSNNTGAGGNGGNGHRRGLSSTSSNDDEQSSTFRYVAGGSQGGWSGTHTGSAAHGTNHPYYSNRRAAAGGSHMLTRAGSVAVAAGLNYGAHGRDGGGNTRYSLKGVNAVAQGSSVGWSSAQGGSSSSGPWAYSGGRGTYRMQQQQRQQQHYTEERYENGAAPLGGWGSDAATDDVFAHLGGLALTKNAVTLCLSDMRDICVPICFLNGWDRQERRRQVQKHMCHVDEAAREEFVLPYLHLFEFLLLSNQLPHELDQSAQRLLFSALDMHARAAVNTYFPDYFRSCIIDEDPAGGDFLSLDDLTLDNETADLRLARHDDPIRYAL